MWCFFQNRPYLICETIVFALIPLIFGQKKPWNLGFIYDDNGEKLDISYILIHVRNINKYTVSAVGSKTFQTERPKAVRVIESYHVHAKFQSRPLYLHIPNFAAFIPH